MPVDSVVVLSIVFPYLVYAFNYANRLLSCCYSFSSYLSIQRNNMAQDEKYTAALLDFLQLP